MSQQAAAMLLVDDGELDDVAALLRELGIPFVHLRGGAIGERIAPPSRLLVTTPRRAMLAKDWPRGEPTRIAIVTEDSNTLRAMLRRVGFDLLLRRPLHPYALRLVLVRALYVGDEKRREERLPVGLEISFRVGFRRKKALLADLSLRGCRMLAEHALTAGTRITVPLPRELSPDGISLQAKVVRSSVKPDAEGRFEVGLAFEGITRERHAELRALLKRMSEAAGVQDGRFLSPAKPASARMAVAQPPAPARPAAAPEAPVASPAQRPTPPARPAAPSQAAAPRAPVSRPSAPPARPAPPGPRPTPASAPPPAAAAQDLEAAKPDRRQHTRGVFSNKVLRLDDEAASVLLGRDLSVGGMRVEYHPDLKIGDLLHLAIYASAREEPLVVKARVVQDSGAGLGLTFEGIDPSVGARLEALVARLPAVESLQLGEADGMGSVVTRVLSGIQGLE